MPEVKQATPESIATLRRNVEAPLNGIKSEIDQRDVDRLMTDDKYAALFVQWSKKEEDTPNLVVKSFKWRHEQKINDLTADQIDDDIMKQGIIFVHGRSVSGSRVLYFRSALTDKKRKDQYVKLLSFWLERIQRREPGERIVFVLDNTNAGMRNNDMGFISFVIECLATYFPCLLDRMIVYNMPTILNAIWKLVSKMLSAEQREATVLCSKEEIFQYINEDNALKHIGGKSTFEYSYPPFPDDLS